MAADGTGEGWAESSPAVTEPVSTGPVEIHDLRKGVRLRMLKEHEEFEADTVGGEHSSGSAKIWNQASAPTLRPDGVTALGVPDKGRVWTDGTRVYGWSGTAWQVMTNYRQIAQLRYLVSDGVVGGSNVADAWTRRVLNTESSDPDSIVALNTSTGVFTLNAGRYAIRGYSIMYGVGAHRARIRQTNNTAATVLLSASVNASVNAVNSLDQTAAFIDGVINVASDGTTFELQYYAANVNGTDGLGHATNTGENELYAQLLIERHHRE